jgi:hypothetical protein
VLFTSVVHAPEGEEMVGRVIPLFWSTCGKLIHCEVVKVTLSLFKHFQTTDVKSTIMLIFRYN